MKFGKQIQSQHIPGWSQYYLDYKSLKKVVSSLSKKSSQQSPPLDAPSAAAATTPQSSGSSPPLRTLWQVATVPGADALRHPPIISSIAHEDERGPTFQLHKVKFFFMLERELEKINSFYLQKEAELKLRLDTLVSKRRAAAIHIVPSGTPDAAARDYVEWAAVEEGFRLLQRDLDKLQQFIEMNATGFRKILKKWDKRSKSTTQELYLSRQVEVQPVFDRKLIAELSDIVATCLLDLTNTAVGPQLTTSNADDIVLRRQLVLESSGQMHAFHDLEQSLQQAVSSSDTALLNECISRANGLHNLQNSKPQISRIFWKAAIAASPSLADLIIFSPPFDFKFVDDINGRTCLHEVAISGETRLIDLCLAQQVEVDRQDAYGRTALHYSAINGHTDACSRLLSNGASVTVADLESHIPLIYAIINGHVSCVNLILLQNPQLSNAGGDLKPLYLACQNGHYEIAVMLINAGAKCKPNTNGEYPIHLAAREGYHEICQFLLDKEGFDISDKFHEWTPLFHASRYGHTTCVKVLLEGGAYSTSTDEYDRTPAFYAAWYGHLDALDALQAIHTVHGPVSSGPLVGKKPHALSTNTSPADNSSSLDGEMDMIPSLSLPPPIMPFRAYGHNYLRGAHLVQILLLNASFDNCPALIQTGSESAGRILAGGKAKLSSVKLVVSCKAQETVAPYVIALPTKNEAIPFAFQLANLDQLHLEFSLYPALGSTIIGRSVFLPSALQGIISRSRFVTPVFDRHLAIVGEITFEMCCISPFNQMPLDAGGALETYWKAATIPYNAVGPRTRLLDGLGQSSPLLERAIPIPSEHSITASSLHGQYRHIIVQITRDLVPVIFSGWHLPINGVDIGVSDVSKEQFTYLFKDVFSKTSPPASILESNISLQDALTHLQPDLGLCIEILYPSPAIQKQLFLGRLNRLNDTIDSVLGAVYGAAVSTTQSSLARRRIIFLSHHPDACAALNWKQPHYPVILATSCGLPINHPPLSTPRCCEEENVCRSIADAVAFAQRNNLIGVSVPADVLLRVPSLVSGIKDSGLMVTSFGTEEQHQLLDDALKPLNEWVDGVVCNSTVSYTDSGVKANF